jgi:hypothetical protein
MKSPLFAGLDLMLCGEWGIDYVDPMVEDPATNPESKFVA